MHAMVAASLLNIVLDPILIYGLGLGIAGAAWGTIISLAAATIVLCYWFFIKKDTYVCFSRQVFIPSRSVVSDILYVGIPASVEYLLMSALNIILNLILVMVATTDAVAVFSVGFRVVSFGIVPIVAIGTSVVSVAGAAYGAKHFGKIRVAHTFSIMFGLAIALSVSILTWVFAYPIASVFSYSPEDVLDLRREHHLLQLAAEGLVAREEALTRASCCVMVLPPCARRPLRRLATMAPADADDVDAAVLVEALVLDRHHRLHQDAATSRSSGTSTRCSLKMVKTGAVVAVVAGSSPAPCRRALAGLRAGAGSSSGPR